MMKKGLTFLFESIILAASGVLALILLTGGFSIRFGPLLIKAHQLTNPTMFLIGGMIARKALTGRFWGQFAVFAMLRRLSEAVLLRFAAPGFWGRRVFTRRLSSSKFGAMLTAFGRSLLEPDVGSIAFPTRHRRGWAGSVNALLGYILVTVVVTYPAIREFSTSMIGWGGDRYIYLWNMWWTRHALLKLGTSPLFTDYIFYPKGLSLAFHDFSVVLTVLSIPFQAFFSLSEIYNLFYLLSYILAGFGMFLLVRYLVGDQHAAFFAGLVFAFWGGRSYYIDHLYLASIQWMPLSVLFLVKTFRERSYRNPLLAALFLFINASTSWYYGIFMGLFLALFFIYHAWAERVEFFTVPTLKRFGVMLVAFVLVLSPLLYPMLKDIVEGQGYMNAGIILNESVSLHALLFPNANHRIWGPFFKAVYERANIPLAWGLPGGSFLTYTLMGLCLYAWMKLKHAKPQFWLLAFGAFIVLALGPYLQIFSGEITALPLPYLFLKRLPVLQSMRVSSRFMVMVMLCGGVAAGYACWDIFRRVRWKTGCLLLLSALFLLESLRDFGVSHIESTPEFYRALRNDTEAYAILELTDLGASAASARRSSLFQITHEKKLFHGFSARIAESVYHDAYALYPMMSDWLVLPQDAIESPSESLKHSLWVEKMGVQEILSWYDVRYVTLYLDYQDGGGFWDNRNQLRILFGEPVAEEYGRSLFRVDPRPLSRNVVFPGFGLSRLHRGDEENSFYRETLESVADIRVLNHQQRQFLELRCLSKQAASTLTEPVRILVNGSVVATFQPGESWSEIIVPRTKMTADENTISFQMPPYREGSGTGGILLKDIVVRFF